MAKFDRNTYANVNKTKEYYSDVLVDFAPHPQKHDLARSINDLAVKSSIRNLLLTNKYERLFNPKVGSKIRSILFEPIDAFTEADLKTAITETIENYEPRAKLINVTVTPYVDENAYVINLLFYIINSPSTEPVSFQTTLYRVR